MIVDIPEELIEDAVFHCLSGRGCDESYLMHIANEVLDQARKQNPSLFEEENTEGK